MSRTKVRWLPTDRAHWLVALQGALVVLLLLSPLAAPHSPAHWTSSRVVGVGLITCALVLGIASLRHLRPSITAAGALKPDGALVTSGPYRLIRHPVYSAQILLGFGWSLAFSTWLAAVCTLALSIVLGFKVVDEERRLLLRFDEYRDYLARTRRLIPFVY